VITIYSLFLFWLISVRMAYGADQEHNPSTVGSPEHHGYIPARLKVSSTGDLIILYPKKYKKKNDRIPWKDFSFTKINRRQCSKTELIFVKKYEAETTGCLIFHFLTENNTQISILTCKK